MSTSNVNSPSQNPDPSTCFSFLFPIRFMEGKKRKRFMESMPGNLQAQSVQVTHKNAKSQELNLAEAPGTGSRAPFAVSYNSPYLAGLYEALLQAFR